MPQGKIDLTEFAGLVTAPGMLQRNPASCVESINWEFPAPGIIRKRRGNDRLPGNTGGPVWKLFTSRLMNANLLAHVGTSTSGTQLRYGDGTVGLTGLTTIDGGNLTRSSTLRMQMALCQRNHYCTSDEGVARVESDIGTSLVRYAGIARGVGFSRLAWGVVPPVSPGAGRPFADGYARAYRVTWHKKDDDGVELGGAPTARWVIANRNYYTGYTGVACNFQMAIQIPREFGTLGTALTTSYYWRLWGTRTFVEATELGDDEMYLITEAYLTAGDIAANLVTYIDTTSDDFLQGSPTLNTNQYNFPPSDAGIRQGIVNEDAPPPVANDVAYWQDCMWYADFAYRARLTVGMIANLADGDTVTVISNGATVVMTARNAPALVTEFQILAAGPTTSINIRQTTMAMVECINVNCRLNGMSAFHVTTTATQPGLVYLELTKPNGLSITFGSSAPTKFQGFDGFSVGSSVDAVSRTNAMAFSKPLRADAVPPINIMEAGPADARILRIFPFRDRILVFTDYGIFQVTGRTFADFALYPFDLGFRLIGREMVALCDEKVYAWCLEGIVEIDDGGVRVVSQSIEPSIESCLISAGGGSTPLAAGRGIVSTLGYAVAYRNQHQVRFHYPEANDFLNMNGCFRWFGFDTRTRTWTNGQFTYKQFGDYYDNRSCAVVRFSDDLLAFGNWSSGADTYLYLERRAYAATDFLETDLTGATQAVESRLTLQCQVPDESGGQHWQQTVINWDCDELTWRPIPSSIQTTHGTENQTTSATTVAVTAQLTRVETPTVSRRGQRLSVSINHTLAEYAGIIGISQTYRGGTRFARRVTP